MLRVEKVANFASVVKGENHARSGGERGSSIKGLIGDVLIPSVS